MAKFYIPEKTLYEYGKDWRKADGLTRWLVYHYWDYYRTYNNLSRREYFLQGVLDEYDDLTDEDKAWLAFLISLTYNNVTAWLIFQILPWPPKKRDEERFWKLNKKNLIFTSDRIYVKINDAFVKIIEDYKAKTGGNQIAYLKSISDGTPEQNWMAVMEKQRFYFYSWFAMILYMKNLNFLGIYPNRQTYVDFVRSQSPLRGIRYVYDDFSITPQKASRLVFQLKETMDKALPFKSSLEHIESNLCPYHKFYEGRRYVGYYIDRDLQEIWKSKQRFPSLDISVLMNARQKYVDARLLGENYGHFKIRAWAEKLYLRKGLIEPIYYGRKY